MTTHFLKKCVAIPKIDEDDDELDIKSKSDVKSKEKIPKFDPERIEELQELYRKNNFKRGSMAFDDFNYH